jgi:hypothetical protein
LLQEEVSVNISKCAFTVASGGANGAAEQPADASQSGTSSEEGDEEDLDDFREIGVSSDALDGLAAALSDDPSALLNPSAQVADLARGAAKALFDYAAKLASAAAAPALDSGGQPRPAAAQQEELYVDGFDAEQVWLQLDMAAAPALKKARRQLRKAAGAERLVPEDVEEALDGGFACSPLLSDEPCWYAAVFCPPALRLNCHAWVFLQSCWLAARVKTARAAVTRMAAANL